MMVLLTVVLMVYYSGSDNDYELQNIDDDQYMYDSFSEFNDSYVTDTDEDSENDNEAKVPDLAVDLVGWATNNECTRSGLNDLLDILRKQGHRLPKDSRTLLQTPRSIYTIKKCGGDYLYLGLESGLLKIISQNLDHFKRNEDIMLSINVDGVPLFKSSGIQLWPILCSVRQFEPFVVAVFCGDAKPNSIQEYLSDFLSELTNLQQDGIHFNDEIGLLRVTVHAFVCDAPARAFVKCTKSYNAYFYCERCIIKGIYRQGRVVYNIDDNLPALRTEQSFKNFEYKDHQITNSPLVYVELSCIRSFPLDYMHLQGSVNYLINNSKHYQVNFFLSTEKCQGSLHGSLVLFII